MNVFFEEDGSFKVASIMTEAQGSIQVESASGKRSKVKANNVLMRFETPLAGGTHSGDGGGLTSVVVVTAGVVVGGTIRWHAP